MAAWAVSQVESRRAGRRDRHAAGAMELGRGRGGWRRVDWWAVRACGQESAAGLVPVRILPASQSAILPLVCVER